MCLGGPKVHTCSVILYNCTSIKGVVQNIFGENVSGGMFMWKDFTTRILKNLVGKKLESGAQVYTNLPCLGEGLASFHLSVETIYGIHHATQFELGSFTLGFERVGCSF